MEEDKFVTKKTDTTDKLILGVALMAAGVGIMLIAHSQIKTEKLLIALGESHIADHRRLMDTSETVMTILDNI